MRARRALISQDARNLAAQAAAKILSDSKVYLDLHHCAVYAALPDEFSCAAIIENLIAHKKNCYLPVISEQGLDFRLYTKDLELKLNRYSISEPMGENIHPEILDCIILPLLGFDIHGGRLGSGGGYYDKTLAKLNPRPLLIGLAYECQRVAALDLESWDVKMDYVLTEERLIDCR